MTDNHDHITLEYVILERRTVWQCARPCSRIYRHRREVPGLKDAICPTCHGPMRKIDGYYQPVEVVSEHPLPE